MLSVIFALYFVSNFLQLSAAQYTEIKAHVGKVAELPCRVDTTQCGKLHSVKWYRDTSRIYVFSQVGGIKRGEGDATERMEVEYEPASTKALLKISPVEIEDDADYKCEITYWEVREHCDIVQIIKLTTLVTPNAVRILNEKGDPVINGTKLKAADEGTKIALRCEAHGGRPTPSVSWYKNGEKLKALYISEETEDGVGTGVSTLYSTLIRADLLSDYTCLVESEALENPIESRVYPDVQVRPTSIELNGLKEYAYQRDEVVMSCVVRGAKPAANVEWKNSTEPLKLPAETRFQEMEDGTFVTISNVRLVPTRYENNRYFQCIAENEVMTRKADASLKATRNLTVYYPPVVNIKPPKVTTSENSSVLLYCDYSANPKELNMVLWQKDGQNLTLSEDRFEGGTTDHPSLRIREVLRTDIGTYTCVLRNSIGVSSSERGISLNVTYPPEVVVFMSPDGPVKEKECANVTLECKIDSGNPNKFEEVKWFIDDELLQQINCSQLTKTAKGDKCDAPTKCNVDPNLILLERVQRSFAGRYSCQGRNAAGWGFKSAEKQLLVYYPPGATKIRYYPTTVIKGTRVTLECDVNDPGSPSNVSFQWYKSNYLSRERNSSKWVIDSVTLSDRTNFTCFAVNDGGRSEPSTVYINVLAPPAFIQKPAPYYGILASSRNVSLTCQIECYPLCSVKWLKDGKHLEVKDNPLFYIIDRIHPADLLKNDFESVESTLVFNITAWGTQELESSDLTTKYTCRTEGNGIGPNITADVEIEVEFPPEGVMVSSNNIRVKEHERPQKVRCSGRGRPNLSYSWMRSGLMENISFGEFLQLGPMLRTDSGTYVCNASNKHGTVSAVVHFDVLYPPECSIKSTYIDNNRALICSAVANPDDVTFVWRKRVENYTIEVRPKFQDNLSSYVIPSNNFRSLRTYICYANNSVGESSFCEIDVPGNMSWWQQLDTDTIVLIIASIISIFICATVVCIIIVLLCRRRGPHHKSTFILQNTDNNHMEMEEREKFLCNHSPDVLGLPLVPCGRVTCLGRPVPHHFSTENKTTIQHDNNSLNPNYTSQDNKGLYENLPFHEMQHPSNKTAFYTLAPHYKHLNSEMSQHHSATLPYSKHAKSTSRDLQLPKNLSSKTKHKQHLQIHLQKCQSLRFQTAESCFQSANNPPEQRNGYTSEDSRSEKRCKRKKHKTERSLGDFQFQEDMHNYVQFQYPQPFLPSHKIAKENGAVYSDIDLPSPVKRKSAHESGGSLSENKEFMPEIVLDVR